MSRKYLNDKWCVRCSKKEPTPYLRDNAKLLGPPSFRAWCVDVGCGNGRNSDWATKLGYEVTGLDMAPRSCAECQDKKGFHLGQDLFPFSPSSVDLVLANYVFMFMNKKERSQVIDEINRVASAICKMVIELYPAKDSETKDDDACTKLRDQLIKAFSKQGWKVLRCSKHRCILERT